MIEDQKKKPEQQLWNIAKELHEKMDELEADINRIYEELEIEVSV